MGEFLDGKKAIVTGASKGIGFAIAGALLSAGADVLICARDQKHIDAALRNLNAIHDHRKIIGRVADVSKSSDVAALFRSVDQELGGLDILVNNAGFGLFRATAELSIRGLGPSYRHQSIGRLLLQPRGH